jgi:hypothetical protein
VRSLITGFFEEIRRRSRAHRYVEIFSLADQGRGGEEENGANRTRELF